jgi:hypothetical protein
MKTKICSKCKIEKLIFEFHKETCNKDSLSRWCKLCHKQYDDYYYKQDGVPKIRNT